MRWWASEVYHLSSSVMNSFNKNEAVFSHASYAFLRLSFFSNFCNYKMVSQLLHDTHTYLNLSRA